MNSENKTSQNEPFMKKEKYKTKDDACDIRKQIFIAACLNIGHLVIGYTVCWSAPVLQKLQNPDTTPLDLPVQESQVMWVAAILDVGVVAGAQLGAFLSNVIGRKPTLLLFGVFLLSSHVVVLIAYNFTTLILGRILNGFGVGGTACGNLVYIGEIASSEFRGTILSSTGVLHTLGALLVFSVAPYVSYTIVEIVVIAISFWHVIALFFIQESPVYHVLKGNYDAAKNALYNLGRSKDVNNELKTMIANAAERNLKYVTIGTEVTKDPKSNWLDIFQRRRNRRAFFITTALFVIQAGAGSTSIMFYATTIFHKAASSVNPDIATILLGVTQVFGVLVAPVFVDKFGRKTLLIFSSAACALCTAVLALHFYLESIDHPLFASIRWLPLAALMSFLFCYNTGLGIIPNVIVGEMFSANVRSTGSSISMCLGFVSGFLSGLTFGYFIIIFGSHIIFIIFAILNALCCLFTVKFVPETRGKSLTEIEAMLA